MLNYAHDQAEGLRQLMFQQKNRNMSIENTTEAPPAQATGALTEAARTRPDVLVWAVFRPDAAAIRHPDDLSEAPTACDWDSSRQCLRINQKMIEQWHDDYAEASSSSAPETQDISHLIDLGNQKADSFLLQFEPGADDLTYAYSLIKLFHQRLGLNVFHIRLLTSATAQATQVYKNLEKAASRYLGVRLHNQTHPQPATRAQGAEGTPMRTENSPSGSQPTERKPGNDLHHRGLIMA